MEQTFEEFDKIVEQTIPKYTEMQKQITFPLIFEKNEIIKCLDIGCGTGRSSYELLKNFPSASVECFDIDKNQLEKAKTNLKVFEDRTEFAEGDFLSHDFEEQFDVIVSSFTMSHLEKNERLQWLRKIHSLLAENGYFVCADKVSFRSIELNDALDIIQSGHAKPSPVTSELSLLRKASFSLRDIIWRFREYAVWYAMK
ncbi:MAG: class I SAM-dependent methyltransferase [Candidatus Aenigmarchaeota archaeon]|nr:class I SAM-dependent methyltransferase [Candidatus Aenigmarchaeota archaeon]